MCLCGLRQDIRPYYTNRHHFTLSLWGIKEIGLYQQGLVEKTNQWSAENVGPCVCLHFPLTPAQPAWRSSSEKSVIKCYARISEQSCMKEI